MTAPRIGSRAERLSHPNAEAVAVAAAEQHKVYVRPVIMHVKDSVSGAVSYVGTPCGNTIESVCPTCARKAKALRMTQCREGWHAETEPIVEARKPSDEEKELATKRADLVEEYRQALDKESRSAIRDQITGIDGRLRSLGVRGKLPDPDGTPKRAKGRSTKRRQDSPDLPRKKVTKTTVGREFAGRFRPSMFITLTCDSYGRVRDDGTPVDPSAYDYRRAARDAVHFAALVDRWWQNLRRVIGWNAQYFATVEPQKRAAPHLHAAVRGSIPHEVLRQVTEATYHQVWWPAFDEPVSSPPRWDGDKFVDAESGLPLTDWDVAVEGLSEPAHVVRFGRQVHSKGILGGSEESSRHIGYLTKYLMKSTTELVEADTDRLRAHHNALHAELAKTPCSPRCAIWLLYGIQPLGSNSSTIPGQCRGRAHRRTLLGLPGRRVLVSRQWSGKTLTDHNLDRVEFVQQALAEIGIEKPQVDQTRYTWRIAKPTDLRLPRRSAILLAEIAKRSRWRAEYDRALLAWKSPPTETSATRPAA